MKRRKDIIVLIIIALVGYASLEYSAIRMTRAMVKYYILSDNITYSEQNGKYPGAGAEKDVAEKKRMHNSKDFFERRFSSANFLVKILYFILTIYTLFGVTYHFLRSMRFLIRYLFRKKRMQ